MRAVLYSILYNVVGVGGEGGQILSQRTLRERRREFANEAANIFRHKCKVECECV